MDLAREKELVDLLNTYDMAGVPILQAKTELLAKGYTEGEIVYGLYSAPFDGKINAPRPANPLQKYYKENPKRAEHLAKVLLVADAQREANKTLAYTVAASVAPGPASSYLELRAADSLGIPYMSLLAFGFALLLVSILFDFSKQTIVLIFFVYNVVINIWFGYKFFAQRIRLHKMREELRKSNRTL